MILGVTKTITNFNDEKITITIPPHSNSNTVIVKNNKGIYKCSCKQRGKLIIGLELTIPSNFSESQLMLLRKVRDLFDISQNI